MEDDIYAKPHHDSSSPCKTCTKCGETKPSGEFYREPNGKFGVRADCKECSKKKSRKFREDNPSYQRAYYDANIEKELLRQAKYRSENPEKTKKAQKIWRENNPDASRLYRNENKERVRSVRASHRRLNIEKYRAYARKYARKVRLRPEVRLNEAIRSGVYKSLKYGKAGRSTFSILGYTLQDLVTHLETLFSEEMTWENYGTIWHVDHIIPLSAHNFESTSDIDFKKAWALENLQPLEASKNLEKGARLSSPFQPSLKIG